MKPFHQLLLATGMAALVSVGTLSASAQQQQPQGGGGFGAGGFDPARIQQMIMDNLRERLEVKDDDEWKVISGSLQKVMDARMQTASGGGMGMFGMMGRRGGQGGQPAGNAGRGGGAAAGPFAALFASSPEADALQKAVDDGASNANLKTAISRFVDARKQKLEALEKAQADFKKLLSVRQEAIAYILGLL